MNATKLPGLIAAAELLALTRERGDDVLVLDASFDLVNPQAGALMHRAAHVPGAIHIDLECDLSGSRSGRNGRHPLPLPQAFAARMAALGADESMTIIVCDRNGGMYAARLWWMLRWVGHADVAVLDGGLAAWQGAGGAVESGPVPPRQQGRFGVRAALESTIDFAAVRAGLGSAPRLIVDARAVDRFRGENETLDPVAGHIPGAVNRYFRDNLNANGRFKPVEQLRAEWMAVLGRRAASDLVQQCGSGVTACHNLLALHAAGLGGSVLYPGSWSEWCAQDGAAVAVG